MKKILSLFVISFFVLGFLGCAQEQEITSDISADSVGEEIIEDEVSEEQVFEDEAETSKTVMPPALVEDNNPPELKDGILLFTFKNRDFSYNFQVKYIDADGDLPRYVFVYINGSRREMYRADDEKLSDPKEGILYILPMSDDELYQITPKAKEGVIEYWFRTNDGHGPVDTEIYNSMVLDLESMGIETESSGGSRSGSSGCRVCG